MKIEDISDNFGYDERGLKISGVDVAPIAEKYGTPLFIYDGATIEAKYDYLRKNLPPQVDIFYAMKANPNLSVISLLVNRGAGVEVASEGELYACSKLGVNPRNIVFAGPSKSDEDIHMAIFMGIYALNAESLGELKRINRIASNLGKVMDVELRINPLFEVAGAAVNMGGGSKKFGIDSEVLGDVIQEAKKLKNIRLQGIHIFAGTGIQDSEGFLSNLENCFRLGDEVNREYYKVLSIDIGGGIGIPYGDGQSGLSIEGISHKISELIEKYTFIGENNARIIAEPGRYLVGQSGLYVTKVIDRKHSRGRDYLLVDGGAQHLLRPALIETAHPTFNISKIGEESMFDVGGSLCTSVDFLGKDISLPVVSGPDDLIAVFCSGAYGYTESMPLFLSHDMAPEILVYKGRDHLVRPSMKTKEITDKMIVPQELL